MQQIEAGSRPERRQAANDNYRGYPALHWLAKRDPHAALAVLHAIRNSAPGTQANAAASEALEVTGDGQPHDVPDEPLTLETMAEPAQDGPDETWPEMLHEIKPDLHGMLQSAGSVAWPWCGVRRKRDGKITWRGEPWRYDHPARMVRNNRGDEIQLAGLRFFRVPKVPKGEDPWRLISYIDAAGKERRPSYLARKPRGGQKPYRTKEGTENYAKLPAAIPAPMDADGYQRPVSDEPALMPMRTPLMRKAPGKFLDINDQVDRVGRYGVEEARAELARHYANDNLPPITKYPTIVAKGARFIAGVSGRKHTASAAAYVHHVPEAEPLSPALEAVAARRTLAGVGRAVGAKGGYSDRKGGAVLLAEGKALADKSGLYAIKIAA